MTAPTGNILSSIPSVDKLLRTTDAKSLINSFGRQSVTNIVREELATLRATLSHNGGESVREISIQQILQTVAERLEENLKPSLKSVLNLTGTVLHTNLGRAPLPKEAIKAMAEVAEGASNLEYNLESGKRGDRDTHLENILINLIGSEAVTIVNNNAAAVLLILNSLALRKEVLVSRGELIEIGGAFRIPEIMKRAGVKLREVGTTNRTHYRDFAESIDTKTAMVMKIHTSNYEVQGFTAAVPEPELAEIAHSNRLPFVTDLGSGTMINLEKYGLPHEPTVQEALANGADLVSFSGDKLLGGPQAGIIAGRADLIKKIKRNPMKRAMRCDKLTIAALTTILHLYSDPDSVATRIPVLRLLTRTPEEIFKTAERLNPIINKSLGEDFLSDIQPCKSQIGSGAMPTERLESFALVIKPHKSKSTGTILARLASSFRKLPVPVIGRIQDNALWLDLRCLEADHEKSFINQIKTLSIN